ncbi:uncharacterized protein LOC119107943 [Pollicipes pollicipes]|uniref:uncharacterized protein LOC119107943 n=1 Tax=Pollicipes pollicipes TaxID=41117 RepID=UPI0018858299|nr:uncharacterized protein LOC119107943 [Pollicipes pollicipes]
MVEALAPALSGPVHQPYPLIADRVLGTWARSTHDFTDGDGRSDTLTSVMLLVLASDLVATIITYAFPRAEPTICLMIILLATFLCPFTWFQSPKNFWMVGVVGLATSLSAWLLLLMKMCADFCQRTQPPPRGPPTPLRMMVGMSSLCSSFISAGVQPTIQADMRDRTAFSGTLTAVWIVITVMVLSFGVTSYILIGSDAKSNVVHNLEPGRLLLAIQILMLTHVLTSFVLYINPLYQELEEKLSIPEVSEALPDFGHVLDIISVLAITITLVLPPLLYLRLAGLPRVDL